jgi:hypothetical protein
MEATISTATGAVRVASLYLPNGNPIGTDKYSYKINWMDRLSHYAQERLELEEPLILAGDYNVIPVPSDAHNPELWVNDALFLPQTRARFRALSYLGLTDAIRAVSADPNLYTFWDLGWRPAKTTASVSTICCRHPQRRIGSPRPASSTCVLGKSHPTTCRCGSSSKMVNKRWLEMGRGDNRCVARQTIPGAL